MALAFLFSFFFQAEDGIRDLYVTGVQTCALPIWPGGRLGISDILADDDLTQAQRMRRSGQLGCLAGAPPFAEYRGGLARAGFTGISITTTHQVGAGVHAAIIRAARP